MSDTKLARLQDRTPVKVTLSLAAGLAADLHDYAAFYQNAYGHEETIADLIPAILEAFLESDRSFARRRKRPHR